MRVALLLARLAGARPPVLRKAPGDLIRHAAMGGVLLTTAGLAGVSAFFALHSALGLSIAASVAAGAGWSVIVLNLDRMLVIGMGSVSGGWQRFLLALPRIALALVIGAVVSTPLVLRIFQPEITAELMSMRAEALEEGNRKLDDAFKAIDELTKQESGLRAVIEGRELPAASQDADVIRAQQRYDAAEATYRKAQAEAECELDGTCGTGRPGVGDSQRQKQREADEAKADRDRALAELNRTIEEAEQRIRDGQASAVEAAKAKLPGVQRDLQVAQERKRIAETETADAENGNTGLMARMTALDRLSDKNAAAAQAQLFLFLLFLCIEILPVLVKLITSVGAKSLYDRMVERADDDADNVDERQVASERAVRDMEDKAKTDLAQQRVDAQLEVGKRATDELVARQTDIALRSVTVWAELAMLRTDEQLQEWYQRNVTHLNGFGPTGPRPSSSTGLPTRPNPLTGPPTPAALRPGTSPTAALPPFGPQAALPASPLPPTATSTPNGQPATPPNPAGQAATTVAMNAISPAARPNSNGQATPPASPTSAGQASAMNAVSPNSNGQATPPAASPNPAGQATATAAMNAVSPLAPPVALSTPNGQATPPASPAQTGAAPLPSGTAPNPATSWQTPSTPAVAPSPAAGTAPKPTAYLPDPNGPLTAASSPAPLPSTTPKPTAPKPTAPKPTAPKPTAPKPTAAMPNMYAPPTPAPTAVQPEPAAFDPTATVPNLTAVLPAAARARRGANGESTTPMRPVNGAASPKSHP
ncbi:DUF4407 domain-containing protein [Actinokineospora diospyrosa]|uniref:DUF4407 domain-containing protein n=1 Tax=Actinokineospora diospyrosa TaxID=103728 RepID=A0ABT1I7V7_9PSEU|nr:DUF4407 domain-containing protein [Actinokineospora diospyrosa]MCP2268703.1 protein of unknown function (DUF4407) [Actinokineospora diospyrosa]